MAGIKQTVATTTLDTLLSPASHLALFTTAPTATTAGTEVSGGSYARQAISFAAAASASKASNSTVTFPAATASWGTVAGWATMTASSGGSQVTFRAITPIVVNSGDQIIIPSGNIIHTLT